MTTRPVKQTPPSKPRVFLTPFGDDGAIAGYPWKVYRFLLSDGRTLDVTAIRDDSDLRGAVLEFTKAERIEGVATIKEVEPPAMTRTRVVKRTKS
jgi:hypothetical protein